MPQDKLPSFSEIMTSTPDMVGNNLAQMAAYCESSTIISSGSTGRKMDANFATSSSLGNNFNFSCSLCDKVFETKDDLTSHTCLNDSSVNVLYECQECKTLFQSLEGLAQHMKVHEQHVVILNKHLPHHLTRLGFTCSYCNKVLSTKGSLIKHQELHKGLKPFGCNFCIKTFSLKGNRDKHELIHAGDKPHKCNICEKTFTLKGNLTQHQLTHSSLKSFRCSVCGKDFTLKGNLDKHLKRHEDGMKKQLDPLSGETGVRKRKQTAIDFDAEAEEEEMEEDWEVVSEKVELRDGKLVKVTKKRLVKVDKKGVDNHMSRACDSDEGTSNEEGVANNMGRACDSDEGVSNEEGVANNMSRTCDSDEGVSNEQEVVANNMRRAWNADEGSSNNVNEHKANYISSEQLQKLRGEWGVERKVVSSDGVRISNKIVKLKMVSASEKGDVARDKGEICRSEDDVEDVEQLKKGVTLKADRGACDNEINSTETGDGVNIMNQ